MNLHTLVIAQHSEQLIKQLSYSFDHPFSLKAPFREDLSNDCQVTAQMFYEWLTLDHIHSSQCIISYNISFKADTLRLVLQRLPSPWNLHLAEYHGKSGDLIRQHDIYCKEINQLLLSDSDESTYALQFTLSTQRIIRIYFLPPFLFTGSYNRLKKYLTQSLLGPFFRNGPEQFLQKRIQPLVPSLHQIFKLLHVIQNYYSLDPYPEDQVLFGDPLAMGLSDFLYEQQVKSIKLILRAGLHKGERILQQVGRLNAPQKWLQKQQYRNIKREVYLLRKKQQHLLKQLQQAKSEVTGTINQLLRLAGRNDVKYHQISLQTLKQLKSDSLIKKTAEINELHSTLKALDLRKQQLSLRKDQILRQNEQLQQQQIIDLLKLKNQVLQLQNKQQTTKSKTRVSPHKQFITTIFSRAQKKEAAQAQLLSQTPKIEAQIKPSVQTEVRRGTTGEFKQAQKKMAAVVRQGGTQSSQLNLLRVQEQRQHAFLQVDFEAQKKFSEKLALLKKALTTFAKAIEAAEQMMFFDQ